MVEKKYIKSFDGIRFIALLGVVLFHLIPNILPSGYLAVAIFFVLAGFLSMREIAGREDKVEFKESFSKIGKKFRKLYPALLILILFTNIIMLFKFSHFITNYIIECIGAVLSISNYTEILSGESYFEAMNSLKPLTHIWALSLEIQFYVLFFLLIYKTYTNSRKNLFVFIFLVLTVFSFALGIYFAKFDFVRAYYSFETRVGAFLIGATFSLFDKSNGKYKFKSFISIILLIIMIALMFIDYDRDVLKIILINVYSILSAILLSLVSKIEESAKENTFLLKALSNDFVKTTAKYSFIIYLFHHPIIVFLNRVLAHTSIDVNFYVVFVIIITYYLSKFIYKIIYRISNTKANKILFTTLIICTVVSLLGIKYITVLNTKDYVGTSIEHNGDKDSIGALDDDEAIKTYREQRLKIIYESDNPYYIQLANLLKRIETVNDEIGGDATLTLDEYLDNMDKKITLIGDSLSEIGKFSLNTYFKNSYIDARGNRQLTNAVKVLEDMIEAGKIGEVVVLALGTNSNSKLDVESLQKMYDMLNGKPLILLTIVIPYVVDEINRNEAIKNFVYTHDNCYLADWNRLMKTNKEYFMEDNVHPKGVGLDAFAQLIFRTVIDIVNWKEKDGRWYYSGIDKNISVDLRGDIGDTVRFGNYYINDKLSKEPIEWIIIDKNEEAKTKKLLSKYALLMMRFNDEYVPTSWYKCDLRKYLNKEFYNEAFSTIGSKFIVSTKLENSLNPKYKTKIMDPTDDMVYIMSYDEIDQYLDKKSLKTRPTKYVKSLDRFGNDYKNVPIWLRTMGKNEYDVMYIDENGEISIEGNASPTEGLCIRPIITIRYE